MIKKWSNMYGTHEDRTKRKNKKAGGPCTSTIQKRRRRERRKQNARTSNKMGGSLL